MHKKRVTLYRTETEDRVHGHRYKVVNICEESLWKSFSNGFYFSMKEKQDYLQREKIVVELFDI